MKNVVDQSGALVRFVSLSVFPYCHRIARCAVHYMSFVLERKKKLKKTAPNNEYQRCKRLSILRSFIHAKAIMRKRDIPQLPTFNFSFLSQRKN